ncbi:hypothetical protein KY310_04390 [Candidatus Woesearchaeota archaeon]|nr:hypothetical protein [Candidatus Woesearchaeota archaeon]
MAFASEENEKIILGLWKEGKSVAEIIKELGWGSRSGGNLTRVLRRAGYEIPYMKQREALYNLTIHNIPDIQGVESLLFEKELKEGEIATPLFSGPDKKLRDRLDRTGLSWVETRNLPPFGAMQIYQSANSYLKVISREAHGKEQVLVIIDGPAERTEDLSAIIQYHYQERGFETK